MSIIVLGACEPGSHLGGSDTPRIEEFFFKCFCPLKLADGEVFSTRKRPGPWPIYDTDSFRSHLKIDITMG